MAAQSPSPLQHGIPGVGGVRGRKWCTRKSGPVPPRRGPRHRGEARCDRKMRMSRGLRAGTALWLLLAAEAVAAFEPISVALAIGVASIYVAYRHPALYCRFAECCGEEKPLNASGTAGRLEGREGRKGQNPAGIRAWRTAHPRWGEGERADGASVWIPALEAVPSV